MRDLQADLDAIKAFTDERMIYDITKEWLKRAIKAEEELLRLHEENSVLRSWKSNTLAYCGGDCPRVYGNEDKISRLAEENELQRQSIQELSEQLAEAQADNAALLEAYMAVESVKGFMTMPPSYMYWSDEKEARYDEAKKRYAKAAEVLSNPYLGAALLQELKQLRKVVDVAKDIAVNLVNMKCENPESVIFRQRLKQTYSFNKLLLKALAELEV